MKHSTSIVTLLALLAAPSALGRQEGDKPPPKEGDRLVGVPEAPPDSPEAKAVLEACSQAIRKARSITYQGYYRAEGGMLEGMLGTQRGTVKMLRVPAPDAAPGPDDAFLALVVGTDISSKKVELPIEVALLHSTIEWADTQKKKVFERPTRDMEARNAIIQASSFLRNEEFFKPRPLGDLLGAAATLAGTETVDGVACDIVSVARGQNRTERWSIATTDRLPRRISTTTGGKFGDIILDLTSVAFDNSETPSLTPAQVRVRVPEGFEEDRRLAPIPRPTPPVTPQVTNGGSSIANPDSKGTKPAPPPEPPKPKTAPEFDLAVGRGANGAPASGRVKLADLHGKVVVLDFFGTWTIESPEWHTDLDALAKDDAFRDVAFLALNVREKSPEAAVAYMDREKHVPELLMNADSVAKTYGVRVYPSTVVIGTDGKIVELVQGSRAGGDSKRLVREAIEKSLGHPASAEATEKPDADKAPAKPEEQPADPK